MTDSRITKARGLMSAGKYDEARKILEEFNHNFDAKELLDKLDAMQSQRRGRNRRRAASNTSGVQTVYEVTEYPVSKNYPQQREFRNPTIKVMGAELDLIPFLFVAAFVFMGLSAVGYLFVRAGSNPFTVIIGIFTSFILIMGWLIIQWRFFWWLIAIQILLAMAWVAWLVSSGDVLVSQVDTFQQQSYQQPQQNDPFIEMMDTIFGW
jgi:hypothetical protein